MAGGARPGAGRPFGARNRKTIAREIVEQAALERRIEARVIAPMQGKDTLEELLGIAHERMHEAIGDGEAGYQRFTEWFVRTLDVAKELTKYQSPQFRAIAVAHTEMRPPVLDLDKLSDKQIEVLRDLIRIAGPSNVAGRGPAGDGGAGPPRRTHRSWTARTR
jgi:hypothetical protein